MGVGASTTRIGGVGYENAPAIVGIIIFLLMALSLVIFAFTLKNEVCDGYCLGLIVFISTSFLLVITLLIVFLIIALLFRNQLLKKPYKKK